MLCLLKGKDSFYKSFASITFQGLVAYIYNQSVKNYEESCDLLKN